MIKSRALIGSLLLCAAGVAWNAAAFDEAALIAKRSRPDRAALPQGSVARVLSLGFRALVADYYWMNGVGYFTEAKNDQVDQSQLADYMDLVIALAPDFENAYRFAGMAIPFKRGGRYIHVERTVDILKRGTERFPDNWFLRLLLSYYYSAHLGRFKEAADQLVLAAEAPGAPGYFASLATRLYAHAGGLSAGEDLARAVLASSDNPIVVDAMKQRLREFHIQRDLDALQRAVDAFRAARGKPPSALMELVNGGFLPKLPESLLDGLFLYDSAAGVVSSPMLPKRIDIILGNPND